MPIPAAAPPDIPELDFFCVDDDVEVDDAPAAAPPLPVVVAEALAEAGSPVELAAEVAAAFVCGGGLATIMRAHGVKLRLSENAACLDRIEEHANSIETYSNRIRNAPPYNVK
jgi:hypothetical protein